MYEDPSINLSIQNTEKLICMTAILTNNVSKF